MEELKEKLNNFFNFHWTKKEKLYLENKEEIDNLFPNIETYQEKIYLLLNNLIEPKRCLNCNKLLKFYIKDYYKTCGKKECIKIIQKAKAKQTFINKYGVDNPMKCKEIQEKGKQTLLKNYGVENPGQSKEIREKIINTLIERHGVTNAYQLESVRQSIRNKLGVDFPFQSSICQEKQKKTLKQNYGVENPGQSKEIREKVIATNLKKYGVENPSNVIQFQEKRKQTFFDKYGTDNPMKCKEIQDKTNITNLERYGTKWPFQSNIIQDKIIQSNLEKYGVKYLLCLKEIRSKIVKSSKFSKLEKKMIEVLTNRGIIFEHLYTIQGDNCTKTFDFAIFKDIEKTELICLVECDGLYYHGYYGDQNGKKVNIEPDINRILFIPKNVKFIVILESQFEEGIKELFNVLEMNYDEYIQNLFNWCRSIEFPYPIYSNEILKTSFQQLKDYKYFLLKSQIGDKIIRHFHYSIWKSKVAKFSPYEAWFQDDLLLRAIKNRFIYKNNIDPSRILEGFNISKIAPKVTIFQPSLARTLIEKYLDQYREIFDPFSGYSGRMLGTVALSKRYIGQDINSIVINESKEIVKYFDIENVFLEVKDVFECEGTYECLFTCPPYNMKEIWFEGQKDLSCDEWIDICLKNFKCESYLFVVDKTEKYKDFIVEEIKNKSHFGENKEFVILIK